LGLGPRRSGELYYEDDIELLATLSGQLGIAVQNTKLFDQSTRAQAEVAQASKMATVGTLAASINHEVRNPLHSIGLEAELALESLAQGSHPPVKQSLASILASVDRLQKITENYLKLSRLSSGEKKRVDAGEILESVLATYASPCESAGVRVDWRREAGAMLMTLGDRDLLEQALGNLIRNALQALEAAPHAQGFIPRITCTLGNTESGKIWMRVRDNGPGIAVEVRDRLFTPFFTTRAQGTGLGLSFVKKVFEEHGGDVQLIDVADGDGEACFELTLPMASSETVWEGPHAENPLS
jgi:signal transduction histidine kinase